MDVYRIEPDDQGWILYKAHGYRPILRADTHVALTEYVLTLTKGKGAVIRFLSEAGVRELRIGDFRDDEEG